MLGACRQRLEDRGQRPVACLAPSVAQPPGQAGFSTMWAGSWLPTVSTGSGAGRVQHAGPCRSSGLVGGQDTGTCQGSEKAWSMGVQAWRGRCFSSTRTAQAKPRAAGLGVSAADRLWLSWPWGHLSHPTGNPAHLGRSPPALSWEKCPPLRDPCLPPRAEKRPGNLAFLFVN